FNGILIIDKPAGWTSHDVVGRVRRLLGQRSVGHAGTLDPAATGVLPVAVGSALRALEFLSNASKQYQAEITFGLTTDALDGDGRLTSTCPPPNHTESELRELLASFVGPGRQVPPVFSAIKIDGTPLHERARRGDMIEPPTRDVFVHELSLDRRSPPVLTVTIDCSKGFYVRSFARDLGERAGSCAYLSNLVRTRVASFDLCDAWTLAELAEAPLMDEWARIALAPDAAALELDAVIIGDDRVRDWSHGKRWPVDARGDRDAVRVYDSAGHWLGIGSITSDGGTQQLHPRKVIPTADPGVEE
ncbi:MAG: tRNA pseudouridine(55) synthase TruB, partial [Thermomicrobiales bacterium]|nr:tRNA pseudouridine(55) synthase TruB [Thermomicrobiales bacterium]